MVALFCGPVDVNGRQRRGKTMTRSQRWAARNPAKRAAHRAVERALKTGILTRQPCPCGNVKAQAHHTNYARPLDVAWACATCHIKAHHADAAWHAACNGKRLDA